ncbi:MAG: transposase zinc-binding domain-containing protein [Candidatus Eisenbacteria bacterium]|nr:transposase zinc-binding domain-containing protein [Candidatus Eisenbacteria bacterium]
MVGRFLDCGLVEHGFARVRCVTCRAEFLVVFRCKGRHFCPSCHARRLAEWSLWLDEHLLAPVPHRQVVLTLPKRLRAYFIHDRRRLGLLSRVASRTLRDYVQAALGEYHAVPGVIACVQTFGSLAHRHPHLHVLMTDGAFRRDGTFVPLPPHDPAVLVESWRRAVLAEFVRRG